MNGLAVCAGAGGLELGLRLALGSEYHAVAYVEWEAYAAATLVARMEDATLEPAPLWDDITTFDGRPWRGVVDIVSAGFPCQPWSPAGKRRGTADARWLWPDIARIVRQVEPRWVFLENSTGLVRGGLEHVLRDLALVGFDAEWDVFSAAQVGAPHLRKRLFLLAYRAGRGCRERRQSSGGSGQFDGGSEALANAGGEGRRRSGKSDCEANQLVQPPHGNDTRGCHAAVEHTNGARCQGSGRAVAAGAQSRAWLALEPSPTVPGHFPPGPDDIAAWSEVLTRAPHLEPAVRRMAHGLAHRLERLRLTGNGVVPVVAAVAFLALWERLMGAP